MRVWRFPLGWKLAKAYQSEELSVLDRVVVTDTEPRRRTFEMSEAWTCTSTWFRVGSGYVSYAKCSETVMEMVWFQKIVQKSSCERGACDHVPQHNLVSYTQSLSRRCVPVYHSWIYKRGKVVAPIAVARGKQVARSRLILVQAGLVG